MVNDGNLQQGAGLSNNRRAAIAVTIPPFILLSLLEFLPGTYIPTLAYFVAAGIWALYVTPRLFGLPNGKKPFREYCADIRLLPLAPLWRNVLFGLLAAALTLSSILLASLLSRHFVLDWSLVPPLRWVKGLSRGIWEEVFFRGIMLVILVRFMTQRRAVLWVTAVFAVVHLNFMNVTFEGIVDMVSLFFIGLLFAYLVLETGSLLPAIVFHYVHDIFVLLVQNTPGAEEPMASIRLYGFLWVALAVAAVLIKYIVERLSVCQSESSVVQT